MLNSLDVPVRMLLVGDNLPELKEATKMAIAAGAEVIRVDDVAQALVSLRNAGGDLVMVDIGCDVKGLIRQMRAERMSTPVLACGVHAPAAAAVEAIKAGAQDYIPLPPDADLIAAAITSVSMRSVRMLGESAGYRQAVRFAMSMSKASVPVLVTGESGTGKEMLARAMHANSGRGGRFVAINCDIGDPDLFEAELFGQEPGAFEGASASRKGRIEEAVGGTLVLREISAAPLATQTKLLELLTNRQFRRLGGMADIRLATSVVATTSVDLDQAVASGRFLPDLQKRLNFVKIALPPLRQRGADIALLADHFIDRFVQLNGLEEKALTPKARTLLEQQFWAGNVRELEQVMLRAVLLAEGRMIQPHHLTRADGALLEDVQDEKPVKERQTDSLVGKTVAEVERDLILQTLAHCGWNRTSASSLLGISVRTMRNKLKSFVEAGIPIKPSLGNNFL